MHQTTGNICATRKYYLNHLLILLTFFIHQLYKEIIYFHVIFISIMLGVTLVGNIFLYHLSCSWLFSYPY